MATVKFGVSCMTIAAAMAGLGAAGAAGAGPIAPGNVLVYRVGTGDAALVNTGAQVFVDEYTPAGVLVQSIAMPSTGEGAKLIASGVATSEGLLTVSPDGRFVSITGYNRELGGTGSLAGTTGVAVNRTVGVIGTVTGDASFTLLSDFSTGNNPRSAVTDDGVNLWLAGGAGGLRYATVGGSSSTQINTPTAFANFRQVNIFNGQLYAGNASTASMNTIALGGIGTGLPTEADQTYNNLPGLPAPNIGSAYAFFFADLDATVDGVDTLYIANDNAQGLHKYSLVAGTWQSNGLIGVAADAYRGVSGFVRPGGDVVLFATRRGGSGAAGGGELVTLVDSSGYNGAFSGTPTILQTAGTNIAFRGVGVLPFGACCTGIGCEIVLSASACSGTFQGPGTTCSPDPCDVVVVTGACCTGTACAITTDVDCSGAFQGGGTVCGAPDNPTTCCPANFNGVNGVTVQDIYDFLAAWNDGLPSADFNGADGVTVQDIYDFLAAWSAGCA